MDRREKGALWEEEGDWEKEGRYGGERGIGRTEGIGGRAGVRIGRREGQGWGEEKGKD